jgi:hypothetical protein
VNCWRAAVAVDAVAVVAAVAAVAPVEAEGSAAVAA